MVLPLRPVYRNRQPLSPMKVLLEPILENWKPQSFDVQLRQEQEPLQVATTALKLNRLGKQRCQPFERHAALFLQQPNQHLQGQQVNLRQLCG